MRFASRLFSLAKDAAHPEQNQDVCRVDESRARVVLADGASTGIFARRWATILADAVINDGPDPHDRQQFFSWLTALRELWQSEIDPATLAWHQKPKLRDGAFSTLLCAWLTPTSDDDEDAPWRLQSYAIGDSCLFLIRRQQTIRMFPMSHSEQFHDDPFVIGSTNLHRDDSLEFEFFDELCHPGDQIVLCTDAFAMWAMQQEEQGETICWDAFWEMSESAWQQHITSRRECGDIRYDDTTLAVLRFIAETSSPDPMQTSRLEPIKEQIQHWSRETSQSLRAAWDWARRSAQRSIHRDP